MMSGTSDLVRQPRILDHAGLLAKIEEDGARLLALVHDKFTGPALDRAAFDFFTSGWHLYRYWLHFDRLDRPRHVGAKKRHTKEPFANILFAVKGIAEGKIGLTLTPGGGGEGDGIEALVVTARMRVEVATLVAVLLGYYRWLLDEQATSSELPWQIQALLDQGFGPGIACA